MKTFLKLAVFAGVACTVAAAEGLFTVFDAEASQTAALNQFDDAPVPAREMRVRSHARSTVERLIWLAVPAAALMLFGGDAARYTLRR